MKSCNLEISRRTLLKAIAGCPLALAAPLLWAQGDTAKVRIVLNYGIGMWYFDPVGLYVQRGQTVEWLASRWGPTVTSFHPSIENQELRIPEGAKPFDSGPLPMGETFRWTFETEGTYDYYSRSHTAMGLIGRIIVGKPAGPGEKPPRYGGAEGRAPIYHRAMRVFEVLNSQEIMTRKSVPFPVQKIGHSYPEY